jgi:hypothetical protein
LTIRVADAAQPPAKLDGVVAMKDGSVVLEFVVILMVKNVALVIAASIK